MKIRDSQPRWVVLTEGTLLLAFTSFSFDESLEVTISSCKISSTNIPFPALEIAVHQDDCILPVLGGNTQGGGGRALMETVDSE